MLASRNWISNFSISFCSIYPEPTPKVARACKVHSCKFIYLFNTTGQRRMQSGAAEITSKCALRASASCATDPRSKAGNCNQGTPLAAQHHDRVPAKVLNHGRGCECMPVLNNVCSSRQNSANAGARLDFRWRCPSMVSCSTHRGSACMQLSWLHHFSVDRGTVGNLACTVLR